MQTVARAVRLSPGINDPTTGVHAIGHNASLLVELADYSPGPLVLLDDEEQPRVVLDRPEFGHFLDLAVAQPPRTNTTP